MRLETKNWDFSGYKFVVLIGLVLMMVTPLIAIVLQYYNQDIWLSFTFCLSGAVLIFFALGMDL